jgi:hypothetical protein
MKIKLLDSKELKDFPSGSGIEFAEDLVYLVGDDILVMTKQWHILDKITLFAGGNGTIAKNPDHELEASTIVYIKKIPHLLLLGSGLNGSSQVKAIIVNLENNSLVEHDLGVFYSRLKAAGIDDLDIEGAAMIEDNLLFCNRANNTHPDNFIIITKNEFWKNQQEAEISVIKIDLVEEKIYLMGVTGLAYSPLNDWLLFTGFTENKNISQADGKRGDSYIGIIENASRKIGRKRMKVNDLQNLSEADEKFAGYKVESVCIQSERDGRLKLHLAAVNDTGLGYLFKIRIKI